MFYNISPEILIPALLLTGAVFILGVYHFILYLQYREKIIWKYSFYLFALFIYNVLDLYYRYIPVVTNREGVIWLANASNFIVILGYASFLMEVVAAWKNKFKKLFTAWRIVSVITIVYIIGCLLAALLGLKELPWAANILRILFVAVGVWAVSALFPVIKGRFVNLIKWGAVVYLFFMVMVMITMLFTPQRRLMGLNPMHWFYLGTFIEVVIFSNAMSLKIKEALLKVLEVRNRISQDLHDDVGATLSGIKVFSQLAKDRPETREEYLDKINNYSDEMLVKMSDIVWSIKTGSDSFEQIISKLRSYALTMTTAKNIQLNFYVDPEIQRNRLDMNLRKNIYLITKEAINNAIKYAACTSIQVILKPNQEGAELTITDDGKGFNKDILNGGNGLLNMQRRAEEINGRFAIETAQTKGTSIRVFFNFT